MVRWSPFSPLLRSTGYILVTFTKYSENFPYKTAVKMKKMKQKCEEGWFLARDWFTWKHKEKGLWKKRGLKKEVVSHQRCLSSISSRAPACCTLAAASNKHPALWWPESIWNRKIRTNVHIDLVASPAVAVSLVLQRLLYELETHSERQWTNL